MKHLTKLHLQFIFYIKERNKPKLNEIRHEVAKDDGFTSVESYINALSKLENKEILFDTYTDIEYCSIDERIYFSTRLSSEELVEIDIDNPEQIAFFIFGENIGSYAMDLSLDSNTVDNEMIYIFNCYFDIENAIEDEVNQALKIHYSQFKSIQAYVFDDIFEVITSALCEHQLGDIIDDFKGDINDIYYETDQEIDVNTHILNDILIKGLPKSLYAYYSSENMSEMSDFQPNVITSQTITDVYRSTIDSLTNSYIKLLLEETQSNPTYAKNKYSAITIHNDNELEQFKSKLFAEYITL